MIAFTPESPFCRHETAITGIFRLKFLVNEMPSTMDTILILVTLSILFSKRLQKSLHYPAK